MVKGRSDTRATGGANRYAAPFPPAVLRSARWRCSCSCGRSCGSSVGNAFCGRAGRYAVMRIVTESPPTHPSSLLHPPDKYRGLYDATVHHKYPRRLFINASRRRHTRNRNITIMAGFARSENIDASLYMRNRDLRDRREHCGTLAKLNVVFYERVRCVCM